MKKRTVPSSQPVCANPHCQRWDIRARGRCQACYVFLRRHGRDATPADMRKSRRHGKRRCHNCDEALEFARGRCQRCYQYWLRTGRERPCKGQTGQCLNCGKRRIYRLGRCRSCYGYLRVHHKDRPGV